MNQDSIQLSKKARSALSKIGIVPSLNMALPWEALRNTALLSELLETGICSLDHVSLPEKYAEYCKEICIREIALFVDAPRSTHLVLDQYGAPFLSQDRFSKAGLAFIRKSQLCSFQEMHREQPDFVKSNLKSSPLSTIAVCVAARWMDKKTQKARALVEFINTLGANWDDVELQNGFAQGDNKPLWEALRRDLEADLMKKSLKGLPSAPRVGPRL